MHFRVVMQGRTLGGAEVEEVKREFVRVTGLPVRVAEMYFNGMPQVIKRQVSKDDAERIAATLRAIGVASTIERELVNGEAEGPDEIRIMANPLMAGPPTIIPGMGGGAMSGSTMRQPRWMRDLREKLPYIIGGVVLLFGAIQLAPIVDEFVQTLRGPAPAPVPTVKRAPAAEVQAAPATLNADLVHGPWRCTDQRTGVATYWTYQDNGALVFHGDSFKDGALVASAPTSAPTAWKISGGSLQLTYPQAATETFAVQALTLTNLRYGDERRRIEIDCRRP